MNTALMLDWFEPADRWRSRNAPQKTAAIPAVEPGTAPRPGSTAPDLAGCTVANNIVLNVLVALAELSGPRWLISPRLDGELLCQRAYEFYVETLYIADDQHVAANRCPIDGRGVLAIVPEEFSGSLSEAIAFIGRPPRWQDEI